LSSAFRETLALLMISLPMGAVAADELKVCADPNNLPFSNQAQEGFENKIMSVVAAELDVTLAYVWWPQRRGVIIEALDTGLCDILPGVADLTGVLLTYPPYYRSTYAFVVPSGEPRFESLDDPRLRALRVGVELVGDDGMNTPPAVALAQRGIVSNVRGYSVLGDYADPNPPARIIDAVARGDIHVAIAWGPLAGYFAQREPTPLVVTPIGAEFDTPDLPMAFNISMALRLDEGALRKRVEDALARRKVEIDKILRDFGVPRLDGDAQ
jgi:mxaJ protein